MTAYESGSFHQSTRLIDPLVEHWVCSRHDHHGDVGFWAVPARTSSVFCGAHWDPDFLRERHPSRGDLVYSFRIASPQTPTDLAADIGWATKALEFGETPTHSDLVAIVSGISKLIASRKTNELGTALNMLVRDPRLRLDVMIAALRGSFPARTQIFQWPDLIATARRRITELGRNPDSLLRGLG